ncbi:hypothetical protein LINPERPRIM_LOCUS12484 [Linum perenne]
MAASSQLFFSLPLPKLSQASTHVRFQLFPVRTRIINFRIRAAGGDLGDFGARDPFPAEIESRFGDKVLGNRGLSMNDFIIAAKIDGIRTSDLAPKKRVWA